MDAKTRPAVIPFKKYIENRMTPYQIGVPIIIAFLITALMATVIFIQYTDSNRIFIESIAPHVATLLETQDGPEIQRFVKAVSTKQGAAIEVISSENEIIASSFDSGRIGNKFEKNLKNISIFDLKSNDGHLMSFANVARINGPEHVGVKLGIYLNIKSIIYVTLGISLAAFIFSFVLINWLISKVINESKASLIPLSELEASIRTIKENYDTFSTKEFNILELENIRLAFTETIKGLEIANEKLTKSKAKEIAANAYRNLIHDLHVPVTALRNHIKIFNHDRATENDREKALVRIVDLAEQILKQVKSARSNLAIEVTPSENNIVESVLKATENAQVALFDKPKVEIKTLISDQTINHPHDPVMLGRAISNLVSNAIEAANSEVLIEVTHSKDSINISVSDDGNGMNQEEASLHLQGRGRSTKSERMGIGIASANHIIRSHGGKIIYQNSKMGGACFEIQLMGATV